VSIKQFFVAAIQLCAVLVVLSGQVAPHAIASDVIVVDAGKKVSVSGGDDLATLQNLFQDANAPNDATIEPERQIIADLKMRRMRILLWDLYCDLDSKGDFITAQPQDPQNPNRGQNFDVLSQEIGWATANGLSPHVALAAFMPQSFAAYGPAETWSPDVMARYESYARKLVLHILDRSFHTSSPAPSVIFEVSNELDIADNPPPGYDQAKTSLTPSQNPAASNHLAPLGPWGRFLWWIDPASYDLKAWPGTPGAYPYAGDVRRVSHGIVPLQNIFADAIRAARTNYPGKTIEIAGPAFSGFSFQYADTQTPLEERFLDYMLDPKTASGRYNSHLDYVSFHYYADFQNGSFGVKTSLYYQTSIKFETDRLHNKLVALGHGDTKKFFVSEWGPSNSDSDINYSYRGAAWSAAFLVEAIKHNITIGSYLAMEDATGFDQTGATGQATLLAKMSGAYYPKPPANVFRMFAMMTGTRNAIVLPDRANRDLGAFAVSDATSAGIVVYNYNGTIFNPLLHATNSVTENPQTFSFVLNNLFFKGKSVNVERYLVDADHSNLQMFISRGIKPDPTHTGLERVEQFTAKVTEDGQLILPARTMKGMGVCFWRVFRAR